MRVNDSVVAPDNSLRVTLIAFDSVSGHGRIKVEEMTIEKGRYYITITYGAAGQTRIDYKTYDVYKSAEHPFSTNRNDAMTGIEIVRVAAD
jgi:hypothetical protein